MSGGRPAMPFFLRVVMVLGVIFGTLSGLSGAAFLFALRAFPRQGPYFVNGASVSRADFFATALPGLGAYLIFAALALATAWGLHRRRLWARPLLLAAGAGMLAASLLAGYLMGLDFGKVVVPVLVSVLTVVFLWWRLYHDDDVLAYYDALAEAERAAARG